MRDVACLCAQWCRTCDAYRDTLLGVRESMQLHPDVAARFVWVDIEDEADLVGDLDIEDFPTILLARREAGLPADIRSFRVVFYNDTIGGKVEVERNLQRHLEAIAGR